MTTSQPWFLYMLECADGSIYTGITNDVDARYAAHLDGRGARYTRSHPPVQLLHVEEHADRSAASKAEWRIKQLKTADKWAYVAAGRAECNQDDEPASSRKARISTSESNRTTRSNRA